MQEILLFLRLFIGSVFLFRASLQDLKSREIDDILWKGLLLSSAFLAAAEAYSKNYIIYGFAKLLLLLASAGILSFLLRRFGTMSSGDAKIIFSLSVLFPSLLPLQQNKFMFPAFFLSVFSNAVILSLSAPLYFFAANLKSIKAGKIKVSSLKGVVRLFIGYYKEEGKVEKFEARLEDKLFLRVDEPGLFEKSASAQDDKAVFVTPALPFVVFIFYGFLASVFYGDLIYAIFR